MNAHLLAPIVAGRLAPPGRTAHPASLAGRIRPRPLRWATGLLMLGLIALTVLTALTARAQTSAIALPAGVSAGPQIEGIAEYRLANGLRVLLLPDPSTDTVTVNITYQVGSAQEGPGESGMAHLLEHMLFKGTATRGDLKAELTRRGARFNGTTSLDRTNYYETLPGTADNLDWALAMEADRMVNSRVARSDLDSEMTVVRNEFESGENSPFRILIERMTSTAYLWHGYGRPIIGARSDIENVPIERLQAFYRTWYQPDTATVVIAGRFDPAQALASAARTLGAIPAPTRALPRSWTREPTQDGERRVTLRRAGDIQIVAAMVHVPPGSHPDYAAVELLVKVLSARPSGRLHRQLVQPGIAANVFGNENQQREAGTALFGATVPPGGSLERAREALLAVLDGVAREPVTAEELERARTSILADYEALARDSRSMAIALTEFVAMGDWRLVAWYRDRIRSTTLDEVRRAGLTWLKADNRTIGEFIPTTTPDRAEVPPPPDLQAQLSGYQGGKSVASGEAFDPVPANIQQRSTVHRLDNDIRLALLPRRTRGERVSVRISLNVGDEQRLANRGAACDAAAQMLMRGSRRHTRAQIVDELDRLQTQLSVTLAGASIDTTRENLAASFALAVELLREPAFPADEFAQLRTATLASLAQRRSDPAARASNRLARHLAPWPRGNVRHVDSFEEDEADWTSVSVDEARRCHAELVGATRADIAVVGDFDPAALTQQVTALMGNWVSPSPWARVRTPHVAVSPLDEQIDTPDKANATWRAALGFALRDDDPAYPALALANYILGGHADSRLWTRVREKEGLSYSVGSGLSVDAHDARARLVMSAIHAPQNRDRVRAAILDELRRALSEGFSTEEVEQNRRSLLEARRVQRTQDANLASRWISLLDADRDWRWEEAMDARLAALSAEEVNTALRRYIDPSQLSVVSAGDFRQSQAGSPGLSPPAGK